MQMAVDARARQIVADMGGHWRGSYGMVCCPAHNDRNPSLQVTPGKKAVLFKCWAGCSQEAVWSALNSRKINRHTSGETVDRAPEPSRRKLALHLWDSAVPIAGTAAERYLRSEEHTSELQSLMRTPYAVFCLHTRTDHKHNAHILTL